MIRRDVLLLGLGLTLSSALPAWAIARPLTDAEKQLVTDISTYNSAIKTMVGRFIQIDTTGAKIEGTFYLQRPDKVRFRYNPPSHEEIISVGRGFYVIDRKEQTQYAYPQDKVPLRQFLTDRINLLGANIIDLVQSDTYCTITLSDDTPEGTVQVLTEPSGQELTFSLYDIEKNVDIPRSYFYIDSTWKAKPPA